MDRQPDLRLDPYQLLTGFHAITGFPTQCPPIVQYILVGNPVRYKQGFGLISMYMGDFTQIFFNRVVPGLSPSIINWIRRKTWIFYLGFHLSLSTWIPVYMYDVYIDFFNGKINLCLDSYLLLTGFNSLTGFSSDPPPIFKGVLKSIKNSNFAPQYSRQQNK